MTPYPYPRLLEILEIYKKNEDTAENIYLVACQHMLESQLNMFKLFIEFGIKPENIYILGKIYSTNFEIIGEGRALGMHVLQPDLTHESFDVQHKNNCLELIGLVPDSQDRDIVVLDDGGQLLEVVNESLLHQRVLFGVEQTSSGFRKLENSTLNFPIVNVARSSIKLTQESPFIIQLCLERIREYMELKNINNPSILIVGLGPIGNTLLQKLTSEGHIVQGFDIAQGHTDLMRTIINIKPHIIVGATGSSILSKDDIEKFANLFEVHLISVSSSDREFPVSDFRDEIEKTIHRNISYKKVTFVNNGFPITFKGNRIESTPAEMEKTIGLLMGSVMHGLRNTYTTKGFIDVPRKLINILEN